MNRKFVMILLLFIVSMFLYGAAGDSHYGILKTVDSVTVGSAKSDTVFMDTLIIPPQYYSACYVGVPIWDVSGALDSGDKVDIIIRSYMATSATGMKERNLVDSTLKSINPATVGFEFDTVTCIGVAKYFTVLVTITVDDTGDTIKVAAPRYTLLSRILGN